MYNIVILMLSICGLFSSPKTPQSTTWKHVNPELSGKDYFEEHDIKGNETVIPFIWKNINYQIFDSLIHRALIRDSEAPETIDTLPEPIFYNLNDLVILYGNKNVIRDGNCSYEVYTFYTNQGKEYSEHDSYELYYIKKIGIIGAVHKKQQELSFQWLRYILVDIKEEKGKSIVNKKRLEKIIEKSITY